MAEDQIGQGVGTPNLLAVDTPTVLSVEGRELFPSREALIIASRIFMFTKKLQDEFAEKEWEEFRLRKPQNRYEVVLGECKRYSAAIQNEFFPQGFDVVTVEEPQTFNQAREGKRYPHTGALMSLGHDRYLWIDPTYNQYKGAGADIVIDCFEGTLEQIKGYVQREYGGRWENISHEYVEQNVRYQTRVGASFGHTRPHVDLDHLSGDINQQIHVKTGNLLPLTEEEVEQNIDENTLRLIAQGFDWTRTDGRARKRLVQQGKLIRVIERDEQGRVKKENYIVPPTQRQPRV